MKQVQKIWDEPMLLIPSVISCCDPCNLERSVRTLEAEGIPVLHVDILDGHFSPSMPLGLDAVAQLKKKAALPFDVHLMATEHDFFVTELIGMGVEQIVFHAETERHLDYRLNQIHEAGIRAGVALKPATPLSVLDYVLEKCDAVLLMLINPGYAQCRAEGQVPYAARKIRALREIISLRGLQTKIILDGRVSRENLRMFGVDGTADSFVVGSTCIQKESLAESARQLLQYRKALLGGQI